MSNLNQNKRAELAIECINLAPKIDFKIELHRWLAYKRKSENKELFSNKQLDLLSDCFAENLKKYLLITKDVTLDNSKIVFSIICF